MSEPAKSLTGRTSRKGFLYDSGRTYKRSGGRCAMFAGLMSAMVTSFDEDGELDLDAAEGVVEHLVAAGGY